jgi:acyl carrier protein
VTLTQEALLRYFGEKLRLDTRQIRPNTSLFASGLIDSFSMVETVLFIEKSCSLRMKPSEVNLDNLDSIERILAFVETRSNGSF